MLPVLPILIPSHNKQGRLWRAARERPRPPAGRPSLGGRRATSAARWPRTAGPSTHGDLQPWVVHRPASLWVLVQDGRAGEPAADGGGPVVRVGEAADCPSSPSTMEAMKGICSGILMDGRRRRQAGCFVVQHIVWLERSKRYLHKKKCKLNMTFHEYNDDFFLQPKI
jgi:hypothetical protein